MSEAIISSLIALLGIIVSVVISLVISLRETKLETQKLKEEYLKQYADKLFEKRLEVYPEISKILVSTVNKINQSVISPSDTKFFADALLDWEAKNAIFLGPQSQHIVYRLHGIFSELNGKHTKDLVQLLRDEESVRTIRKQLIELFLALKNDLGIYALKPASTITGTKAPTSMSEVDELFGINSAKSKQ
jgi:hypothetical protein